MDREKGWYKDRLTGRIPSVRFDVMDFVLLSLVLLVRSLGRARLL